MLFRSLYSDENIHVDFLIALIYLSAKIRHPNDLIVHEVLLLDFIFNCSTFNVKLKSVHLNFIDF
jgi:hypothetical protein